MHPEDLILFKGNTDEATQILIRKKYVELYSSQTELTASLFIFCYVSVPKKNNSRDLGFTR